MIRTTLVRSAFPMRPRPRPLSPPSLSRSTTSSSITRETPVVVTLKHLIPVAGFIIGLAGWAYSGLRNDLSALVKAQHELNKKVDVGFAKVDLQFSRLEATLVTIKNMITDRDLRHTWGSPPSSPH
ncbi:hypothetical protein JCM3770_007276 [Rhodotorula araucariae]